MLRDDQKSVCPSMNSRKDSGIRSNSRKSSIQQSVIIYPTVAIIKGHSIIARTTIAMRPIRLISIAIIIMQGVGVYYVD